MVKNSEIAAAFYHLADLLEAENSNPYRIRAYRRAARTIENYKKEFYDLVLAKAELREIPNIGSVIAKQIINLINNKELPSSNKITTAHNKKPYYNELMQIKGLGPKRIQRLNNMQIYTKKALTQALKQKKLNALPGFNKQLVEQIEWGLLHPSKPKKEFRLFHTMPIIESIVIKLKTLPHVEEVIPTGAYRRRKELIDEVTIIVLSNQSRSVIEKFAHFSELSVIFSQERHEITAQLVTGLHIKLIVASKKVYWQKVLYYTGSERHLKALEKIALHSKKFNYYQKQTHHKKHLNSEAEIYDLLELAYIEPELRENTGEIIAARNKKLPNLIALNQIRGDLHCHTNATDGWDSLETMARAAADKGYEYIAITDHTQHLTIANGLDKKRLLQQIKLIDKLNEKDLGIRILKSTEMDILEDGSLDFPNDLLKELDFTVCSIHSKFRIPKDKQTERILRAMDNPYFNILGHATGRLIKRRPPYEIDIIKVLTAAKERNCFIELNAQPYRLDINNMYCHMAKKMGVKLSISSDAHSTRELNYMKYGIYEARRGWLEAKDVINTRSLSELIKLFHR